MVVKPNKQQSLDSSIQNLQVTMYPNPANNYVMLQLSQDVTSLQLKIMDGTGRVVVNQPLTTIGGLATVNTISFNSGLYYVSLYSSSDKIFGQKLSIFK